MTFKFSEIMKKFYEDEKLGIQSEDAPANSVAAGGVDMPADAVSKKKQKEIQKKNLYDGRRKEAKAFFKRIEALRAKRDNTFREKVKENINSFGEEYLLENNVDILRKIVKNKQNMPVKMKDGKMKVDLFTASAFVQAIDSKNLKPDNKKKLEDMINKGSKADFLRILNVIMK
tara:strand:+ start:3064 stop:3582 length:519 start_codon:yes stop_codon:yes gene_type:complete